MPQTSLNSLCICCLSSSAENQLQMYTLKTAHLRNIFQMDCLILCYLCQAVAKRVENFIYNVQKNQLWVKQSNFDHSTISKDSISPIFNLSIETPNNIIELEQGDGIADEIKTEVVEKNIISEIIKLPSLPSAVSKNDECTENLLKDIKCEMVEDCFDADLDIKEEDDYPLNYLKKELELNGVRRKCKEKFSKKRNKKRKTEKKIYGNDTEIYEQECLEEKCQKLEAPRYINRQFKCEKCVKGFEFELSYKKHMELHSENNGDYECNICNIRVASPDILQRHIKNVHFTRYRCTECGLTRISRRAVEYHYIALHSQTQFVCHLCGKIFKRKKSLISHLNIHKQREKVKCDHCEKHYITKSALKMHLRRSHSSLPPKYVCEECGAAFITPSHLKQHERKHDDKKDFYCVECDKNFKTEKSLNYHLKITRSHNKNSDLPLPCEHCDKRFAVKRDLERHKNRIHLNVRPFKCDQCDRAYINAWSLKEHQRLSHEGFKRPLKFPCTMCHKVFDRGTILKAHIRTHTGERPYQCPQCPAQFSQPGVRNTHLRLIHLKLTRDGRPKNVTYTDIHSK